MSDWPYTRYALTSRRSSKNNDKIEIYAHGVGVFGGVTLAEDIDPSDEDRWRAALARAYALGASSVREAVADLSNWPRHGFSIRVGAVVRLRSGDDRWIVRVADQGPRKLRLVLERDLATECEALEQDIAEVLRP